MLTLFRPHKAQQEHLNQSYETKIERLLILTQSFHPDIPPAHTEEALAVLG